MKIFKFPEKSQIQVKLKETELVCYYMPFNCVSEDGGRVAMVSEEAEALSSLLPPHCDKSLSVC